MIFWRISNYADLKGSGGTKVAERWHNKGAPVVYLAGNPALALIEVLVHFELDLDEVPETYRLLEVEYTQRKGVSRLSSKALAAGWQKDVDKTRAIGDEWLGRRTSPLLRVPSALVPESYNYLLNPLHPDAKLATIKSAIEHPYDVRLFD